MAAAASLLSLLPRPAPSQPCRFSPVRSPSSRRKPSFSISIPHSAAPSSSNPTPVTTEEPPKPQIELEFLGVTPFPSLSTACAVSSFAFLHAIPPVCWCSAAESWSRRGVPGGQGVRGQGDELRGRWELRYLHCGGTSALKLSIDVNSDWLL
ncbi:hypothetical protein B296_00053269 [Ensete ventricosum]|uniref:Uncharacterized protein n=1 Tax=Ensete ventricosum TaxID=4639 RepID=A0A426Y8W6_ENSVE|nr:hypothetical protein B296_00053269 [Ensete ventricosum]